MEQASSSGSSAAINADLLNLGPNIIIVRPIDPTNSEQISRAGENLVNICGSEHVRPHQTSDGTPSWLVTLSDRETLQYLPEHPWLQLDDVAKQTFTSFTKRHAKRAELSPRDDLFYNIAAKDYNNDEETKATREFLNGKLTNPDQEIIEFTYPGTSHVLGWGHVQLSEAAKKELEEYAGIVSPLGEDGPVDDERAVSDNGLNAPRIARASRLSGMVQSSYMAYTKRAALLKRAVTWTKQAPASWDLNMVSQPKEMKGDQVRDFVYDENAGAGTWVYVIDSGAALSVINPDGDREFENVETLQTKPSKDAGEAEDSDGSDASHGTKVSSKAVGKKYGVAKRATLVSVKMRNEKSRSTADFIKAVEDVVDHLADDSRADRRSKTVIISSLGFSKADPTHTTLLRPIFESLFALGIPFVSSSGNLGELIPDINKLPKTLAGPDMPILIVGAVDDQRKKTPYSQVGKDEDMIYAPGGTEAHKVEVQSKLDKNEGEGSPGEDKGTSFAAPIVAGVIATYFNYDPKPWDDSKTGKERVQAIKDFIRSDSSSWTDSGLTRTVWNGATRADHQSTGANGQSIPPSGPTKALSILGEYTPGASTFDWLFFSTDYGTAPACRTDTATDPKTVEFSDTGVTYPGGTWQVDLAGEQCEYKNSGDNPGALFCNGKEIACFDEETDSQPDKGEYECGDKKRQPVFTCPY